VLEILPKELLTWFAQAGIDQLPIYLVGGAIRDQLMNLQSRDFDFIVREGAVEFARKSADHFHGDFYILDKERGTARVLINRSGQRLVLDFANFHGSTLNEDLAHRDFSINAIARQVTRLEEMIDPMHGADDIHSRVIRVCSPSSFVEDPVRCMRAVRFAFQLEFNIDPFTSSRLQESAPLLANTSIERQRDELFHILAANKPAEAIQGLLDAGIISQLLPELMPLVRYSQSDHHTHDAWQHTLSVIIYCRKIMDWIDNPEKFQTTNPYLQLAVQRLNPLQPFLSRYFNEPGYDSRSFKSIFLFAALYHDVGKPATRTETSDGIQFVNHEVVGAQMAASRAKDLALSNREVILIEEIIRNHMLIHPIARQENLDLREAAFRYYQASGSAGVADCIFSLADLLSTYEAKMDPVRWDAGLRMSFQLLDAWMNHYDEYVHPHLLLNGEDLKDSFTIHPGPLFGQLLADLEFAQAVGKVQTREMALEFIRDRLSGIQD
jgi:poly(A) polymerase